MLSILLKTPVEILEEIGARAKDARLALGFTRKTLSVRSGVPEATIKRFETTGQIGTEALVNIAMALNKTSNLDELFKETPASYINETPSNKRKRGIR
jgi:transcriptional regulator with XRE-family HTH domain